MQRQNFASLIRVSIVLCLSLLVVMLGGLLKPEAAVQTVSFGAKTDFSTGSNPVSATATTAAPFSQQGPKLVGTGTVGNASQGGSVSISADGSTAIVGGVNDSGGAGAAWVWTRNGGVWTPQGPKLVGSGAVGNANQGSSVALSADGNTAIVGGSCDNGCAGAAWVWRRSGGVWTPQGPKLVGSDAVGTAFQGHSVSLSADGNTAIVGGLADNSFAGAAWVWTRSGGVWTPQGPKLVGLDAVGSAQQGNSVSLSADGNTAIVGGRGDNSDAGAAWIWTRSGGVWNPLGSKLIGPGAVGDAQQGYSVSLSADGNTAIVGGPFDNVQTGAAWVWTRSGGVWTQQGAKLVGSGAVGFPLQGSSVSLSADGNTAIIGGEGDSFAVGAAWAWTRVGVWTQQGSKLVGSGAVGGTSGNPQQGHSVSLSADGDTAVVGGPIDNSGVGAAWVFTASLCSSAVVCRAGSNPCATKEFIQREGGSGQINVSAISGDCTWSAETTANWITVPSTMHSGPGSTSYTVAANDTAQPRTGTIAAAGKTFTVRQYASGCTVAPLTPLTDPDALAFEAGNNINTDMLVPSLKTAQVSFRSQVIALGGSYTLSSAWRPNAYQAHLLEVYQHWQLLNNNLSDQCRDLRVSVEAEMDRHGLKHLTTAPANPGGPHTTGNAIDVSIGGLSPEQIRSVADDLDICRPLPQKDRVHYQLSSTSSRGECAPPSGPMNSETPMALAANPTLPTLLGVSIKVVEQGLSDRVVYHYRLVNNSDQVIVGFHVGDNGGVPELSELPLGWDGDEGIPPTSATSARGWHAEALAQEESDYHLLQWDTSDFATASLPGQSLSGFSVTLAQADSSYKTAHAKVIFDDGSAYAVPLEVDTAPLTAPSEQAFGADGGTGTFTVLVADGQSWQAASDAGWITIIVGATGSGNGTVSYSVAANTGPTRIGTMDVAGRTFTVTQDSGCAFSLGAASQSFGSNGGTGSVDVTCGAGCDWTATSNDSWITITSGGAGIGNGMVDYSVDSNLSVNSRTGTITVGGQTFTVDQSGFAAIGLSSFKTDFDSDGKTDIGFYRAGLWGFLKSTQSFNTGSSLFFSWGGTGWQPICADFDGDGKADIAYIVPPSGGQSAAYAILQSSTGYSFAPGDVLFFPAGFPVLGDIPVVGDFDGDGKADPGIWRASQGVWIIPQSSTNYTGYIFSQWGQQGDVPVIADFDMDGKADVGFYRDGLWGVLKSGQNYSLGSAQFFSWGGAGLQPIVGDFDGDGKADIGHIVAPAGGQSAAYAILKSTTGYSFLPGDVLFVPAGFPVLGDTPVVGDVDGDGKADPGIWRESQGVWILPRSSSNYTTYIFSQWGQLGDIAFPNSTGKH